MRVGGEIHLVVEREPLDVDGAAADEQSERDPLALAGRTHNDICRELAVDVLVRAATDTAVDIRI